MRLASKIIYVSEPVYAELIEADLREFNLSETYDGTGMLSVFEKYLPSEDVTELKGVFTSVVVVKTLKWPMIRAWELMEDASRNSK